MSLKITEEVEREKAKIEFLNIFGLHYELLINDKDTEIIKISSQYGKAGVDVRKSISLAEKFGEKGYPFIRNFL